MDAGQLGKTGVTYPVRVSLIELGVQNSTDAATIFPIGPNLYSGRNVDTAKNIRQRASNKAAPPVCLAKSRCCTQNIVLEPVSKF